MKPGICLSRVWSDDDIMQLRIDVSDGTSFFSNQVYVGWKTFEDAVASLDAFKNQVHGGLLDLRFGEFGPENAGGASHARFHFVSPGKLHVSCEQESEFQEFAQKKVAGRATLYSRSEPVLLDRFLAELKAMAGCRSEAARLEGI